MKKYKNGNATWKCWSNVSHENIIRISIHGTNSNKCNPGLTKHKQTENNNTYFTSYTGIKTDVMLEKSFCKRNTLGMAALTNLSDWSHFSMIMGEVFATLNALSSNNYYFNNSSYSNMLDNTINSLATENNGFVIHSQLIYKSTVFQ